VNSLSKGSTATMSTQPYKINQKFIEILSNILIEQNRQLIKCISEDYDYPVEKLANLLQTKQGFHDLLIGYLRSEDKRDFKA